MTEYTKKYGNIDGVTKNLSFEDIGELVSDKVIALSADIPSFKRLDETFGSGASVCWLYSHLKKLLVTVGVTEMKMSDSQIRVLAGIIVSNFPSIKLTEFMLFESRFLGGKYEQFYGETSYVLAITRSLRMFCRELRIIYEMIEAEKSLQADKSCDHITWEEYCKSKGYMGTPPSPGHLSTKLLK